MDRKGRKGPERTAFSETPNPELAKVKDRYRYKYCGTFATKLVIYKE
jgi:hypothetical protein